MAITRLGGANAITGTLPAANINDTSISNITALPAAVPVGAMTLIKTTTASNVSSVIFDNGSDGVVLDNTYDCYFLNIVKAYGATNDQKLRIITRVGGSDETAGAFRNQIMYHTYNGSTSTNPASAPNNDKLFQVSGTVRNTNPEYFQGQFFFYGMGLNTRLYMTYQGAYKNNSGYHHNEAGSSGDDTTQTTDGLKINMASGNIYGTFSLYGIKT
jgi:hypothetical protein